MSAERITATYRFETPHDPQRVAETIAGEQSSGTFVQVPGETPELKSRHGARVESLELLAENSQPSLPYSRPPKTAAPPVYRSARLVVSWPLENLGPSLPNLLATVAGNLFELAELSGLRLLDLDLPPAFARAYPGPACGIAGTRRLAASMDAR